MVPLSRAIGRKRALDMLLTGRPIDAATALDWGLVNRVVPAPALDEEVAIIVNAIARSSPLTVGIGKEAFYAQIELDEHRAYDLTKAVMAMNARADDAQEGMSAFLEKRAPAWRGRLVRAPQRDTNRTHRDGCRRASRPGTAMATTMSTTTPMFHMAPSSKRSDHQQRKRRRDRGPVHPGVPGPQTDPAFDAGRRACSLRDYPARPVAVKGRSLWSVHMPATRHKPTNPAHSLCTPPETHRPPSRTHPRPEHHRPIGRCLEVWAA
jgi:hypothetical protein